MRLIECDRKKSLTVELSRQEQKVLRAASYDGRSTNGGCVRRDPMLPRYVLEESLVQT